MKAYIHAFQGKPWNEECETAYIGFEKLGIECILFTTNEELDTRLPGDIVVGGMLMMEHALTQLGVSIPNYNYPEELLKYRGRRIWNTRLKDLNQETLPIFIKPDEEKAARAMILMDYCDLSEYNHLDEEAVIICSDVVNFVSEWRCFIRYGELLGVQFYNGNSSMKCDISVIESAINDFVSIPAACSLDFGVTDDGKTLLIEMNDGLAIGCYGLAAESYAQFLYARWAELVGVVDPWDIRVRDGYIEDAIKIEYDKVWDAYLSIDIKAKDGTETVNEELRKKLIGTTKYLGLMDFFDRNSNSDVWISDDDIHLDENREVYYILNAIIGKDVLVHLRVASDKVAAVEHALEEVAKKESRDEMSFLKWRYSDDKYLIELMKRLPDRSTYIVRFYEDGNGVIVYSGKEELLFHYFKIKPNLRNSLINNIDKKINDIVAKPVWTGEDDRFFGFSVHLKFNIYNRYPDADKRLKKYQGYETVDYCDDEYKLKVAKQLLSAPEVKNKWLKMHSYGEE